MAVIDVITYSGEKELFEIRYNILKDYVDNFIVIAFDKTFSGNPREKFDVDFNGWPKVSCYWVTEEDYTKYKELAESSPNTKYGKSAKHWVTEFCQKESIKDVLIYLKDDDIVFVGDADEIWDPYWIKMWTSGKPTKLKLKVYTYWLNNRSNEEFWGTLVSQYKYIKNSCLNHLRSWDWNEYGDDGTHWKTPGEYGWHFTSLHSYLREKLLASYTEESYATPWVMEHLEENIKQNKDFLGRDFTFKVDESDWPPWLTEHRQDYKHLLK